MRGSPAIRSPPSPLQAGGGCSELPSAELMCPRTWKPLPPRCDRDPRGSCWAPAWHLPSVFPAMPWVPGELGRRAVPAALSAGGVRSCFRTEFFLLQQLFQHPSKIQAHCWHGEFSYRLKKTVSKSILDLGLTVFLNLIKVCDFLASRSWSDQMPLGL